MTAWVLAVSVVLMGSAADGDAPLRRELAVSVSSAQGEPADNPQPEASAASGEGQGPAPASAGTEAEGVSLQDRLAQQSPGANSGFAVHPQQLAAGLGAGLGLDVLTLGVTWAVAAATAGTLRCDFDCLGGSLLTVITAVTLLPIGILAHPFFVAWAELATPSALERMNASGPALLGSIITSFVGAGIAFAALVFPAAFWPLMIGGYLIRSFGAPLVTSLMIQRTPLAAPRLPSGTPVTLREFPASPGVLLTF